MSVTSTDHESFAIDLLFRKFKMFFGSNLNTVDMKNVSLDANDLKFKFEERK